MSTARPLDKKFLTVADLVAGFLVDKGVRYVFGLPGGENVLLMDAMRRAGLQFVLVHHEASAGFAADVWGQLHGQPGVCLATVGPGAINLLASVAGATLERSPVLAITAEVDAALQQRITHMQLNLPALYGSVTKRSLTLTTDMAARQLDQAWNLACAPPFGAVHISLSPAVAATRPKIAAAESPRLRTTTKREGSQASLSGAQRLLESADRLMLIAGVGVEMSGARLALLRLAKAWNIPVTVTPKAKGQFPESDSRYSGCFTAYADEPIRRELERCDLILGVGLDGVDFVTSTWDIPTPLINLNPWSLPDPVTNPQITLSGDLTSTIDQIIPWRGKDAEGEMRASALRRQVRVGLETGWPAGRDYIRLAPLIRGLRDAIPPDGIITLDVGAFKLVFLQAWPTDQEKTLFVANGLSAMGYAIPGAMAIKLAQPEHEVVAIVGDGALHMYLGELATIARLGLGITVFVIVDHALALIRLKQLRSKVPVYGTEFGAVAYPLIARAHDFDYVLLDSERDMEGALRQLRNGTRPKLVEARIHLDEYDHFK